MIYLRNAWYPAAWDEELGDKPLARTFLDEPVVLYRDSAGEPTALRDMCPHRFAPLSLGKIKGDCIQCPYHGLVYDKSGACVHNPNGKGTTPTSLSVASYPLHASDGMIWIWMGDPEKAVGTEPPRYPFLVKEGSNCLHGYLQVGANYQLVTDNLLDLTHAEFLHPFIAGSGDGDYGEVEFRAEQVDGRVSAYHYMPRHKMTPLFRPFLDEAVKQLDGRAHLHWEAPANMMLDVGATVTDGEEDVALPQVHLLTPETEDSTHYFWGLSRDREVDNAELSKALREGINHAFEYEDEPMVRAVAQRMGGRPLFEMSPAFLPQDEAAVRARRYLARLISSETEQDTPSTR